MSWAKTHQFNQEATESKGPNNGKQNCVDRKIYKFISGYRGGRLGLTPGPTKSVCRTTYCYHVVASFLRFLPTFKERRVYSIFLHREKCLRQ